MELLGEPFKVGSRALSHHLDPAVMKVADPSCEFKITGEALCVIPESHTLNLAREEDMPEEHPVS